MNGLSCLCLICFSTTSFLLLLLVFAFFSSSSFLISSISFRVFASQRTETVCNLFKTVFFNSICLDRVCFSARPGNQKSAHSRPITSSGIETVLVVVHRDRFFPASTLSCSSVNQSFFYVDHPPPPPASAPRSSTSVHHLLIDLSDRITCAASTSRSDSVCFDLRVVIWTTTTTRTKTTKDHAQD